MVPLWELRFSKFDVRDKNKNILIMASTATWLRFDILLDLAYRLFIQSSSIQSVSNSVVRKYR